MLFADPSGNLTRGQIHDKVLDEIIRREREKGRTTLTRRKTCIYYNGVNCTGGWGFCDLYDTVTGEVWELKRITCDEQAAKDQLDGYVHGALKHKKNLSLKVGRRLMSKGVRESFIWEDSSGTYYIEYWDGGNGILWYDYIYEPSDRQKRINAAAAVGVTVAACAVVGLVVAYSGGAATPTVAPIIPYVAATAEQFGRVA